VAKGYACQWTSHTKVPWTTLIWARPNIPRNAFISWVLINHRLPTKKRLAKFQPHLDTLCAMCSTEEENEDHLFYDCSCAQEIWDHPKQWWSSLPIAPDNIQLLRYLKNHKGSTTLKQITSAVITGIFYHIWRARNHRIVKNQQITASQTAYLIKDQARTRILFLNTCSKKYSRDIDRLLS